MSLDAEDLAEFFALTGENKAFISETSRVRRARYDPNARDADLDRIVQEGTPFARPAAPRVPGREAWRAHADSGTLQADTALRRARGLKPINQRTGAVEPDKKPQAATLAFRSAGTDQPAVPKADVGSAARLMKMGATKGSAANILRQRQHGWSRGRKPGDTEFVGGGQRIPGRSRPPSAKVMYVKPEDVKLGDTVWNGRNVGKVTPSAVYRTGDSHLIADYGQGRRRVEVMSTGAYFPKMKDRMVTKGPAVIGHSYPPGDPEFDGSDLEGGEDPDAYPTFDIQYEGPDARGNMLFYPTDLVPVVVTLNGQDVPRGGASKTKADGSLSWLELKRVRGRAVAYNPDAVDADRDMIVQEGTPYARPATPRRVPALPPEGEGTGISFGGSGTARRSGRPPSGDMHLRWSFTSQGSDAPVDPLAGLGRRKRRISGTPGHKPRRDPKEIARLKARPVRNEMTHEPNVNFDELSDIMGFKGDDERDNFLYWLTEDGGDDAWWHITDQAAHQGTSGKGTVGDVIPALERAYKRSRDSAPQRDFPYPFPDRFDPPKPVRKHRGGKRRHGSRVAMADAQTTLDPWDEAKITQLMGLRPDQRDDATKRMVKAGLDSTAFDQARRGLADVPPDRQDEYLDAFKRALDAEPNMRKRREFSTQQAADEVARAAVGAPSRRRRGQVVTGAPAPFLRSAGGDQPIDPEDVGFARHLSVVHASHPEMVAGDNFNPTGWYLEDDQGNAFDGPFTDAVQAQEQLDYHRSRGRALSYGPDAPIDPGARPITDLAVGLNDPGNEHFEADLQAVLGQVGDVTPYPDDPRAVMVTTNPQHGAGGNVYTTRRVLNVAGLDYLQTDEDTFVVALPHTGPDRFPEPGPSRMGGRLGARRGKQPRIPRLPNRQQDAETRLERRARRQQAMRTLRTMRGDPAFAAAGADQPFDPGGGKKTAAEVGAWLDGIGAKYGHGPSTAPARIQGGAKKAPAVLGVPKTGKPAPKAKAPKVAAPKGNGPDVTVARNYPKNNWVIRYRQGDLIRNVPIPGTSKNDDYHAAYAAAQGMSDLPAGANLIDESGRVQSQIRFTAQGTPYETTSPTKVMDLTVPVPKDMNEVKAAVASLQAELQAETSGRGYFPAHDNKPTQKALDREMKIRAIGAGIDDLAHADPKYVQLKAAEDVVLDDYMKTTLTGRGDRQKLKAWWDANASTERYLAEVNRQLLAQIRPMGPQGDKSKYDNISYMNGNAPDNAPLEKAVDKAIEYYPSEWIDTFHDWSIQMESDPNAAMLGAGGYFDPTDEAKKEGHIHVDEAKPATVAHEMGHVMERTRRALPQAEWVFLMRRAHNADPGTDVDYPNGFTYIDEFMDGYIGHAYYPHAAARGYTRHNFEVFTRGMEWITGYGKKMRTQKQKDADYRAFLIGALAVL